MGLSPAARVVLIAMGLLVVFAGIGAWQIETDYGGGSAIEHHQLGYLADGSVEVRVIDWNGPAGWVGDYEVVSTETGQYAVQWIDPPEGSGSVIYSGPFAEVATWLDDQGPALYEGTAAGAIDWLQDRKAEARNFSTAGFIIAAGCLLIVVSFIPSRRKSVGSSSRPLPPATPTISAG